MGKFIFLALIVAGFAYQDNIKKEFYLMLGGNAARTTIEQNCKMRASCEDGMKPASQKCVEGAATAGVDRGMDAMKRSLVSCLSRAFMERSCKDEERCIAAVHSDFDTCWNLAYPMTVSIDDSSRQYVLRECLQGQVRRY